MSRLATDVFSGLTENARVSLDGVEYVMYSDGVASEFVLASDFDNVSERYQDDANGYSLWCCEESDAVSSRALFARLLTAAGQNACHSHAVGGWVEPLPAPVAVAAISHCCGGENRSRGSLALEAMEGGPVMGDDDWVFCGSADHGGQQARIFDYPACE